MAGRRIHPSPPAPLPQGERGERRPLAALRQALAAETRQILLPASSAGRRRGLGLCGRRAACRGPIGSSTFSFPPIARSMRRAATPCWCGCKSSAMFAGRIRRAISSKWSSATRINSSAPISKRPAVRMCKSMARVFSRPMLLGDPGAKTPGPTTKSCSRWSAFPSHVHDGEGVITEVLGRRGEPGVDTLSIIREFNLPEHFADDVLDDARAQADRFDEAIRAAALDLTAETVITIDPVDARDFDDAISLVRLSNGHWQLGVHIADVSHFVRTAVAARSRGAEPRHQRLSARPRDSDAAGDYLERPGELAARQGAVHEERCSSSSRPTALALRPIRIRRRSAVAGGSRMKRSIAFWPIAKAWLSRADARGSCPAGANARAGDDPARAAIPPRGARIDDEGSESRSGRRWPGVGAHRRREHRKPSDHRRIHARGQRSRGRNSASMPVCRFCAACIPIPIRASSRRSTNSWPQMGFQTESLQSRFELQELLKLVEGQAGAARGELCRAAQPAARRSTARRKKGTTRWRAIAIAISHRRSAAIPI